MFEPGSTEIVVGASVQRTFAGTAIGETLAFAQRRWTVVGVFDAGGTAFDSEIWGDAEQMLQAFRRTGFSSVIAQLGSADQLASLQAAIEVEPRLQVDVEARAAVLRGPEPVAVELHQHPRHQRCR